MYFVASAPPLSVSSGGQARSAYPRSRSSPWNWSTRLRRWVRMRMPPVRDASTKPSAATVLPAPVACSNQNRLAALGSSGASATSASSSRDGSDQSSGSPPRPHLGVVLAGRVRPVQRLVLGLVLDELLGQVLLARDRRRGEQERLLRARAVGATRVPVAVGRALGLREERGQRARERVDLVGGEHGAVDECRLVLGEQAVEAQQQGPPAPPLRGRDLPAVGQLGERPVERGAPRSAGGERDGGVLALEQERLTGERSGPLELVGRWKGCDREGRCLRLSHEGSTNRRKGKPRFPTHDFELPGRNGEASSGSPARKAPHIQAESGDGHRGSATVCPRCDGSRPSSAASCWSHCWPSGSRRRARATAERPPSDRSTSPRRSESWRAPRRRWPGCTASPPASSAAGAPRSDAGSGGAGGPPGWGGSGG